VSIDGDHGLARNSEARFPWHQATRDSARCNSVRAQHWLLILPAPLHADGKVPRLNHVISCQHGLVERPVPQDFRPQVHAAQHRRSPQPTGPLPDRPLVRFQHAPSFQVGPAGPTGHESAACSPAPSPTPRAPSGGHRSRVPSGGNLLVRRLLEVADRPYESSRPGPRAGFGGGDVMIAWGSDRR
jgi:hypothetical protein